MKQLNFTKGDEVVLDIGEELVKVHLNQFLWN